MSNTSPEFMGLKAAGNRLRDPEFMGLVQIKVGYDEAATCVLGLENAIATRLGATTEDGVPVTTFRMSMAEMLDNKRKMEQRTQPDTFIAAMQPGEESVAASYYIPLLNARLLRGTYTYDAVVKETGSEPVKKLSRKEAGSRISIIKNTLFLPEPTEAPHDKAPSAASILKSRLYSGTASARKF